MPTAAERYEFPEVENDGRKFLLETAKLCKVDCFEHRTGVYILSLSNNQKQDGGQGLGWSAAQIRIATILPLKLC